MKVISQIRLNETVYDKLKYIANRELRSMNNQFEYFVVQGIERYEKENDLNSGDEYWKTEE